MSGVPTEAEIRTQWVNAVDILEKHRVYADATVATAGELDVLIQSIEGTYTPDLVSAVQRFRAGLSDLISPATAREFLLPILFEYQKIIDASNTDFGGGYDDPDRIMKALYNYHANAGTPITIESREITIDTVATESDDEGGSIVGNGKMTRLTVDDRAYPIENVHIERKRFICRADQNSGATEQAEIFEHLGQASSPDNLMRQDSATAPTWGSGTTERKFIRSRHSGSGAGGSLLRNSSFSTFDDSSTETKYVGWTQSYSVMTASGVSQDAVNFYRSNPGASVDASLKLTVTGGSTNSIIMTQTLSNMLVSRLDPERPYFLRIMVNPTTGTAAGGTVKLRLGTQEVTIAVSVLGGGWEELFIPADANTWYRNFNQDGFGIDIEWVGGTSGYLLVDDVIFCEYDKIDATYWVLRGNNATHIPFLTGDTLVFFDQAGLPSGGKLQWWLFIAGLGYLPSEAVPVIADP